MRSVRLGDRSVPAVGSGDVSLSIAASRGVDRRDVERALTVALELGLSLVDIHPGEDDAERLAGEVIRSLRMRDSAIAAVTIPLLAGRDTPIERLPPRYIQARVETALRNSKLDALPLVQLPLRPAWLSSKVWLEIEGTAARLIREGKVLAWGARLDANDLDDCEHPLGASEHGERVLGASDGERVLGASDGERVLGVKERGERVLGVKERGDRALDASEREEPKIEDDLADGLRSLLAVSWFVCVSIPFNLCARAAEPLIAAATAPVPLGPEPPPPASVAQTSSLIVSAFEITAPTPTVTAARPPRRTAPLAVLARQPLAGGALAGALGPGVKLTPRDDRTALDTATLDRIALEVARLAPLVRTVPPAARATEASRAVLERNRKHEHVGAVTLAELALRYVIDRGAIALPRLHRHTLVTDALIAAASDPLPERAIAWILDGET